MVKNLKYFGVFVVLAFLLTACVAEAELPPAPSSTAPLVEYSIDEGETWHSLTEDEVKRLYTQAVWIRQTEKGVVFKIDVRSDLGFAGSIARVGFTIAAKGNGAVIVMANGESYAKIILE